LQLEALTLHNFKNYNELSVQLKGKIICLLGENGSGKTNFLDAIHYLAIGKSCTNPLDSQNITHDNEFFSIRGKFKNNSEKTEIQCTLKKGQKKIMKWNGNEYDRLSEHVGRIPLVMIAPDDTDLVREHSDGRRRFVDGILSQVDSVYLKNLIQYHRILKQRNGVLKNLSDQGRKDPALLEVYDEQLIDIGHNIYDNRRRFIEQFKPFFSKHYRDISDGKEAVSLVYRSSLKNEDFPDMFRRNLEKDIVMERTQLGIHRDDFVFKIDNYPLKKFGSQGQQKSFLISLKLAQHDFIKEEKGFCPLLLLDDIFDKLDDFRITKLMQLIHNGEFGQIFVTDAREKRTRQIMKNADVKATFLCIENNKIHAC